MPDRSQFLLDARLVASKWEALEETASAIILFKSGCGIRAPLVITPFFVHLEGIHVRPPFTVTATFIGVPGDGHLLFDAEAGGKKESMLGGLEVETSLAGFIEALYLAFHLPTKHASGHGLYGRDYTLLTGVDTRDNENGIDGYGPFRPEDLKPKLDRPAGIRVAKHRGKFYVSCIAVYDFGSIVDFTVRIAERRATMLWPPEVLFESGTRITY